MTTRIEQVRKELDAKGLDGMLISNLTNIYYLTGFSGTNAHVFVSRHRLIFLTDSRYIVRARELVKGFEIYETRDELGELVKLLATDGLETIGFEDSISFAYYARLQTVFSAYNLQSVSQLVETIRQVKDASEIATIRTACSISDRAFLDVLDFIKAGKTELEVANFLDFRMRELGATGVSFETIAASGYRSSMPHGVASDKVIQEGDALTLDFGCYYNHYVSDMTRTVYVGHVSDEEREIYETVLAANQALTAVAKSRMSRKAYDKVARDVIVAAGYGAHFTHGIGHGMGLDVHEEPYFGAYAEGDIQTNMVLTNEPGIYIDEKYGVRIEDDLLITETGCEVLTLAPRELIVI